MRDRSAVSGTRRRLDTRHLAPWPEPKLAETPFDYDPICRVLICSFPRRPGGPRSQEQQCLERVLRRIETLAAKQIMPRSPFWVWPTREEVTPHPRPPNGSIAGAEIETHTSLRKDSRCVITNPRSGECIRGVTGPRPDIATCSNWPKGEGRRCCQYALGKCAL
jgi:hypothetical protein